MQSIRLENDCILLKQFFSKQDSDRFFTYLVKYVEWQQIQIKLFGKTHPVPRLTAFYGDIDSRYSYSGHTHQAMAWNSILLEIKKQIEDNTNERLSKSINNMPLQNYFNSALLNLYRNGNDSMGWHSDDELELGTNPIIASVSLGEKRAFRIKEKENKKSETIYLEHGDVCFMLNEFQNKFLHCVPKQKNSVESRINITLRKIIPNNINER